MGYKKVKKKDFEWTVKTNLPVLLIFLFVIIFFVYGLVTFYFDILSFFS